MGPLFAAAWTAAAAGGIANLGPPTATLSTNQDMPLMGFLRLREQYALRTRPPQLLVVDTGWDNDSAATRWSTVKALEQFGTWFGLEPGSSNVRVPGRGAPAPQYATFDWSRAHYRSVYVQFVHRDIANRDGDHQDSLSRAQTRLYARFGKDSPLLAVIGDYYLNGALFPYGDLAAADGKPLTFSAIESAMRSRSSGAYASLVSDINAGSNIITALICHADGSKPRGVCGRAVIREILRHVK